MSPSKLPLSALEVTFLGTASAQPSSTRNHSSLALRLAGDVWLFDCGEGTQLQLQRSEIKMGRIEKIFITHTHGASHKHIVRRSSLIIAPLIFAGDHIFGIVPLMASMLNGAGGITEGADDPRSQIDFDQPVSAINTATQTVILKFYKLLEIYGPYGTRAYIRNSIIHTHTYLGSPYVVHELRLPTDPESDPEPHRLAHAESPNGRNVAQQNGVWVMFFNSQIASVSAARILHSIPCVGYVVEEAPVPGKMDPNLYTPELKRTNTPLSALRQLQLGEDVTLVDGTVLRGPEKRPGRKVVILGDTCDPSAMIGISMDPDLLIHEATNAHLPGIDLPTKAMDTYESVEERTKSRGHSTPQMAGKFATAIRAKQLVLNHFSSRYSGADDPDATAIMRAIGKLAESEYGKGVTCAKDFMKVKVASRT